MLRPSAGRLGWVHLSVLVLAIVERASRKLERKWINGNLKQRAQACAAFIISKVIRFYFTLFVGLSLARSLARTVFDILHIIFISDILLWIDKDTELCVERCALHIDIDCMHVVWQRSAALVFMCCDDVRDGREIPWSPWSCRKQSHRKDYTCCAVSLSLLLCCRLGLSRVEHDQWRKFNSDRQQTRVINPCEWIYLCESNMWSMWLMRC